MFKEHRELKENNLSDLLPWDCLIAPAIVLNKNGSFQSTIRYRGQDLDSATRAELISISSRLNNILKRLEEGWVIFSEAQRKKTTEYPQDCFPDYATKKIDEERKDFFKSGDLYESDYYITLLYLPPSDQQDKIKEMLITRDEEIIRSGYIRHLTNFKNNFLKLVDRLSEIMPEVEILKEGDLLTYLHSTISEKDNFINAPMKLAGIPIFLDSILPDTHLVGGFEPRLGKKHLKVISIMAFPTSSVPGTFDSLNRLGIEYRWCTRFIALDKKTTMAEIINYRKLHYAKRKGVINMLKEIFVQGETAEVMLDPEATEKANEANEALSDVQNDYVAGGYYTMTVTIVDEDYEALEEKVRLIEKNITNLGFTTIVESYNCLDAWLSSLPGNITANVRRPLFNSLSLVHLLPTSAVWAGAKKNKHLNSSSLLYTTTMGSTPFRLNLHYKDVGHTMIIGPTGSGKSTLLALIAAQFRRYKNAQVYFFDKDCSSKVLTYGVGGDFYNLAEGKEDELSFQPLARINLESEINWANEWLLDILVSENIKITTEIKKAVWSALQTLSKAPETQRTFSGLQMNMQNKILRDALTPFTIEGSYGRLFDSDFDNLSNGFWQVFEMGKLMNIKGACSHILSYLFHRLETDRLNGNPTLFILDECWLFLENEQFREKIAEWLRVLRKKNGSVIFATQSLSDVANSPILPAIQESCFTKIFLANPNAKTEQNQAIYKQFDINEKETEIISQMQPKRDYYFKSPDGSRSFDLNLSKLSLAWLGSSTKEDLDLADQILEKFGVDFNKYWLQAKGIELTEENNVFSK